MCYFLDMIVDNGKATIRWSRSLLATPTTGTSQDEVAAHYGKIELKAYMIRSGGEAF